MRRLLLAPLIFTFLSPAQADKPKSWMDELMDSKYVDFGKTINKSVENSKKEESEFSKGFCKDTFKDERSRKNCISYLSPYGEAADKVENKFALTYCLPGESLKGHISDPNADRIKNLQNCLAGLTNLKRPTSLALENHPSQYPSSFTHKGKLYIASRACKPPRRMVWTTYPSFLGIGGKVEEAGCMTPLELEAFNREKRLRRASRPVIINNPAQVTQPSGGGMIVPMYQKPINCYGVNYGGAGFSATCN